MANWQYLGARAPVWRQRPCAVIPGSRHPHRVTPRQTVAVQRRNYSTFTRPVTLESRQPTENRGRAVARTRRLTSPRTSPPAPSRVNDQLVNDRLSTYQLVTGRENGPGTTLCDTLKSASAADRWHGTTRPMNVRLPV